MEQMLIKLFVSCSRAQIRFVIKFAICTMAGMPCVPFLLSAEAFGRNSFAEAARAYDVMLSFDQQPRHHQFPLRTHPRKPHKMYFV